MKRIITIIEFEDEEDKEATLYTFKFEGEDKNEYEKYWEKYENDEKIQWDFDVIDQRINKIVEEGCLDCHFRPEGGGLKAIPPTFISGKLRLYCYRVSHHILILGNGGIKLRNPDPEKNKTKDFPELYIHSETLRKIGRIVDRKIKKREIECDRKLHDFSEPIEIEIPEIPTK